MDGFTPKVAGAQANETPESILEEELERLKHEKNRLKDENSNYIKKHPELQPLLDEFLTEILIKKPHVLLELIFIFILFSYVIFRILFVLDNNSFLKKLKIHKRFLLIFT